MDILSLLSGLPGLLNDVTLIRGIWDETWSNDDFTTKVKKLAPSSAQVLEDIGSFAFPQASPLIHLVAGFVKVINPNRTKWLQGMINLGLDHYGWTGEKLVVDGDYGPKTHDAVVFLQGKLGLVTDGVAGVLTETALQKLVGG